jgi:hypothetical protein
MTPQIAYIATTLSGLEQASLAAVVVGLVGLIAARLIAGDGGITRRAYGKIYGGAPGADAESKPEA